MCYSISLGLRPQNRKFRVYCHLQSFLLEIGDSTENTPLQFPDSLRSAVHWSIPQKHWHTGEGDHLSKKARHESSQPPKGWLKSTDVWKLSSAALGRGSIEVYIICIPKFCGIKITLHSVGSPEISHINFFVLFPVSLPPYLTHFSLKHFLNQSLTHKSSFSESYWQRPK